MKILLPLCLMLVCIKLEYAQTIVQPNANATGLDNLNFLASKSTLVIEGRAIRKKGIMRADGNIYTLETIKISRIFKGNISDSTAEVLFQGGSANGMVIIASAGLCVDTGAEGIFFLKDNNTGPVESNNKQSFVPALFSGCFIEYHDKAHMVAHHVATCGYITYDDLKEDLFNPLKSIIGIPIRVMDLNMFEREATNKQINRK